MDFPPELWASQAHAIDAGMLDADYDAWSMAAPTGTGKTFLMRLLILQTLREHPGRKILYVVPSKALVHQVSVDLHRALDRVGVEVVSVTAQLTSLDAGEEDELAPAGVLVLTPEKADLLLRIGAKFLNEVALVIVDEAHHL
jgi:replicative superfamily II helicase